MEANFVPKPGKAGALLRVAAALAGVCLLALAAPGARALQSDRTQPLLVDAGDMRYDDATQSTVFTGPVVMRKGTLVLHADKVVARQLADGYDEATAYGRAAKPAVFDQVLDAPPGQPRPTVHGSALELHYDGRSDTLTLTGQALLERSLDGHLSDRAQGSVIVYNELTDVFTVHSGESGKSPTNPQGRVRVMLSPRAAPAASAPAASHDKR